MASPGPTPELDRRLGADLVFRAAFEALTPGRQKEYRFHLGSAKKPETREARLAKCTPNILAGLGLRDGRQPLPKLAEGQVRLLSGGNPQIPKGDGPGPVAAYLDAVPGWKNQVARDLDALIVTSVPGVRKAVRWNSPWYGVAGNGWFLSYHCFERYLKVTFVNGIHLAPQPPESSKDPEARYVHLTAEASDDAQLGRWIEQAAALPGWDGF